MMLHSLSALAIVGYSPPLSESARRSSPIFWIFLFGLVALLFVLFWYFTRSKHTDDHTGDHSSDDTAAPSSSAKASEDAPVAVPVTAEVVAEPTVEIVETETVIEVEDEVEAPESDASAERSATVFETEEVIDVPEAASEDLQAAVEPVVAPIASTAPAATLEPDNLRRIEGIGPKIAGILNDNGIITFAQLADTSVIQLQQILTDAGLSRISKPDTWPEQAQLAAAGDWDDLDQLQDSLKGGRRA